MAEIEILTTLAKSDRTDRETFYWLSMTADLSKFAGKGGFREMTEQEFRTLSKEQGMSADEIQRWLDNARLMRLKAH